jgi:hypothetical protein
MHITRVRSTTIEPPPARTAKPQAIDRIMKIVICSLMLCFFTAASTLAGDSGEMLRQRLALCHQLVIEHPYAPSFRDLTGFVGSPERVGNRVHECHFDAKHPQ